MKLDRRSFLHVSGTAAVTAMIHPAGTHAAPTPGRRPIKISAKYGMISGGKTVLGKFQIAREAGFEGLEPGGPLSDAEMEQFKSAIETTGVVVPNMVCPKGGRQMGASDEKQRKEGVELFKTTLRQSKALGGTTVLMYPGIVDEQNRYHEVYENLLRSTREALPVAEETGIKIALENVWNNLFISPLDAVHFVDTINSPYCGWFFDIGNIARYGWPEHWVRALGKRIFKLDIKDYDSKKHMAEGPRAGFGCDIGDGDINFAAVMKALDEIGYSGGWIAAEVKGGDLARLKDIVVRIQKVLAL